jgi:glycosyltransferase involved in cell wall biosynthesis
MSAGVTNMRNSNINPQNTVFVLISFEGPDCYSMAGGLGVRMQHLSHTLAGLGYETHLFYIGDPDLPGEEHLENGKLILHRWCQWISSYHPNGVYDGEEGKLADFNASLPSFAVERIIAPAGAEGKVVAVLGEEWQTAETLCRLNDLLISRNLRQKVIMFWNANNTFSFNRVNWARLSNAATITSVSRYMKHIMEKMGFSTLVIPNGIPHTLLHRVDNSSAESLRNDLRRDILLCKVARWDPDKRWMEALEATASLKAMGFRTTLLARGGMEAYGQEILQKAHHLGLMVKDANLDPVRKESYQTALSAAMPADVINIRFSLPLDFLAVMYRATDAVLASSGHEPFGIVGLEAMAAGGIVFTGNTGEDYAIPFVNSFSIDTSDPAEIVSYILYLKNNPAAARHIRTSARVTARYYTWENAARILINKLENQGRVQKVLPAQTFIPQPAETIRIGEITDGLKYLMAERKATENTAANRRCISREAIHP